MVNIVLEKLIPGLPSSNEPDRDASACCLDNIQVVHFVEHSLVSVITHC